MPNSDNLNPTSPFSSFPSTNLTLAQNLSPTTHRPCGPLRLFMGKVIVAIKPVSTSGGASGVTRYIAESKRNPQKEGLAEKEPRPLVSATEDRLTYLEANKIPAHPTGALAEKEDVIHIVISPEKGQFEQLGETLEERREAFKEIIREAAQEIEKEVEFVELSWIAGIHLNTEIPHAHLALSRDGWDRSTERAKHINIFHALSCLITSETRITKRYLFRERLLRLLVTVSRSNENSCCKKLSKKN